jgi:hypothetical protein
VPSCRIERVLLPNFHFRSKPFLHFRNDPDRTCADVRFG